MISSIISDHGRNFKSILFSELCRLCGIKPINSTFYHPEGNGLSERTIKSTKQILTMYVDVSHRNWDVHLQAAISAYNTSPHASIGCTPYEVVFARKPVVVADIILSNRVNVESKPISDYVKSLGEASFHIQDQVRSQIAKSQSRQKDYFDRFVKNSAKFCVGDSVLLINERSIVGQSKSFRDRTLGPFKILEIYNDVNYRIKNIADGKIQDVHFNRLRPYRTRVDFIQPSTHSSSDLLPSRQSPVCLMTAQPEIDSFAVTQFLALLSNTNMPVRARSPTAVDISNYLFPDLVEDEEITKVKTKCPICAKEFIRVSIHIGKSRDQAHKDYRENLVEIEATNDAASEIETV